MDTEEGVTKLLNDLNPSKALGPEELHLRKVQVGNDQEMAQSKRNFHSINRGMVKTKMTQVLIPRKYIVNRVSSYSPIGGHSVIPTELKYENVYTAQTAQKFDSKTKNN